jgi:hypothetical protein
MPGVLRATIKSLLRTCKAMYTTRPTRHQAVVYPQTPLCSLRHPAVLSHHILRCAIDILLPEARPLMRMHKPTRLDLPAPHAEMAISVVLGQAGYVPVGPGALERVVRLVACSEVTARFAWLVAAPAMLMVARSVGRGSWSYVCGLVCLYFDLEQEMRYLEWRCSSDCW